MTTRAEAERMALTFLHENGPHTMGVIEDDGAVAAFMIFLDLEKTRFVSRTDFGGGNVQFALTDAGRHSLGIAA